MALRRGAWLAMSRIAAPRAPDRKPWETVSMGHYQRSLVCDGDPHDGLAAPDDRATRGLARLIDAVNDSGEPYLTGTRVGGRTALRFAVGQTTTTEAHVARAWERIAAIARAP